MAALSLFFHVYILCFHNNIPKLFIAANMTSTSLVSILENKTNKRVVATAVSAMIK